MASKRRKLAAILSADIVGFSRLMEDDEADTVRALKAYRALFSEQVGRYRGRIVNMPGDALLAEFASAIDAVECAASVQGLLAKQNHDRPAKRRMQCRIGVNLGDVVEDGRSLLGDGVNIAARLEALADPGGVCVSGKVFDEIDGKVTLELEYVGERQVKNISAPLRVYKLRPTPPLTLRLLGEMELWRGTKRVELPQSKKTRALLAYLVLRQKPERRERLCNLFWDVADDPRAALRWSLTKLRPLVDDADCTRLVTDGASLRFDPGDMRIDVFAVRETLQQRADALTVEELTALAGEFRGELLEGLDLPDFHEFQIWCASARADVRALHALVLGTLVERLMDQPEAALPHMRTLAQIEPADPNFRSGLIIILTRAGHLQEAREQAELARELLQEIRQVPSAELQEACNAVGVSLGGPSRRVAAVPPPTPPVRVTTPTIDLVGRSSEMQQLGRALDAAGQQRTLQIVLLIGEPGIGKTRLLNEIIAATAGRHGTVLHGAAFEVESNRPYGPWLDALRRIPPSAIGDTIGTDLSLLLPELGASTPAQHSRDRLFGAVVELIAARAHSAPPVLLAFDDMQWCDDASAELLHYVIRMNRHRPVLVALAARDGEIHDNESMSRVLRALRRDSGVEEIAIGPLSAAETSALVQPLASAGDSDRVFAASAGNPLFALELARSLGHWQEQMPATLRQLVRDRVERLPSDAAELLRWGSLLGQTLHVQRLIELLPLDLDHLMNALEVVERHGLLRPTTDAKPPGSAYRFTHDLVREVVHAELSEPRRRLMHLRITRTLQDLGDSDARIADLAHHAALAGESEIAARACIGAGRRYLRVFASAEADAIARRGMHHAQDLNTPESVKLKLELAEICYAARRPRDAKAAEREVESLAQDALAAGYMEHARLGFHLLAYLHCEDGDWSDAQRHMMRAEQVSRASDARERVVALAEAARCLTMLERDLSHAEALLLEASALSSRLGIEPTAIPDAVGMLRLHEGRWDDAAQQFTHARDLCRKEQDRLGEYRALEHLIMLELQRRQFTVARTLTSELVHLGERLREGSEAPFARTLSALCDYADSASNAAALDATLSDLRLVDAKQRLAGVLLIIAEIDLERGAASSARVRADEALQLAEHLQRPSDTVIARTLLARAALALGDTGMVARVRAALSAEHLRGVSRAARNAADQLGTPVHDTTEGGMP